MINSKFGVIGNKVQELKVKSNSSRAWDDVLNLSRVSAWQEPIVTQPINPPSIANHVPITVSKAATAAELVTVQDLRRDPVLVQQAKAKQQALQEGTAQDYTQGRAQGDNINNNNLYDAHHCVHSSNFLSNHNDVRSRVLNNNFPSNYNHCNSQGANNIKSNRESVGNPEHSTCMFVGRSRPSS